MSHKQTYEQVRAEADPVTACSILGENPSAIRGLVRSVPFPEVLMALLPEQALVQLGRRIICDARVQMLQRVEAMTEPAIAKLSKTWKTAISEASSLGAKWMLAHDERRWSKLESTVLKSTSGVRLHRRAPKDLAAEDWARLVVYLLLL